MIVLALSTAAQVVAQTPILGGAKERQPSYGELENFTILSYTDLDGWDQAAEFRVSRDGKHLHIELSGVQHRRCQRSPPPDLTGRHANAHTAGDLYWWLSYGVKPTSAMPGFSQSLSDEERWDLINYLRALASGERAKNLAPVIEDKPWLVAPDFAYETNNGEAKAL